MVFGLLWSDSTYSPIHFSLYSQELLFSSLTEILRGLLGQGLWCFGGKYVNFKWLPEQQSQPRGRAE